MAKKAKADTVRVKMISGVRGEDKTSWEAGTIHEASIPFAEWLVYRKKAVPVGGPAPEAVGDDPPVKTGLTTQNTPKRRKRG